MAKASFAVVMPYVFAHEGGYVDHPSDPGGATNMGITIGTLSAWRGYTVTKADVKALTKDEAMEIYRKNYWNVVKGDDLPAGVDYAVLDFAINSGPTRAAQYLQRLVFVDDDGKIGPITLGAVAAHDAALLVEVYCDDRLDYLKGLSTWSTFGKGWERRVEEVYEHALELAEKPADAPWPAPAPFPPLTLEQRVTALELEVGGLKSRLGY